MNILVLCKRQYTARDLLTDRYGRLFEIPEGLAALGHRVHGLASSYRPRLSVARLETPAGVSWRSVNAVPWGPFHATSALRDIVEDASPDIIWASSDALHAIWASEVAHALQVPVVIDLYDNYEHFGLSRLPSVERRFHAACQSAAGLSIVSNSLKRHLDETCQPRGICRVIGNGVAPKIFHSRSQPECRAALGLPHHARIMGCAGAIRHDRGIDDLFDAFELLARDDPSLYLAFAGPRDGIPMRYHHPRIIDLGILDWHQVPLLINSLDVVVVCNKDSSFGRYCSPLKLNEALACQVPVVAARVGDVSDMLRANLPVHGYSPGNAAELAFKVKQLLDHSRPPPSSFPPANDWLKLAIDTADLLQLAWQQPTNHRQDAGR